jgi:hypothetical protein
MTSQRESGHLGKAQFKPLATQSGQAYINARTKGRYRSGQTGRTVNPLAYAFAGSNPALPISRFATANGAGSSSEPRSCYHKRVEGRALTQKPVAKQKAAARGDRFSRKLMASSTAAVASATTTAAATAVAATAATTAVTTATAAVTTTAAATTTTAAATGRT